MISASASEDYTKSIINVYKGQTVPSSLLITSFFFNLLPNTKYKNVFTVFSIFSFFFCLFQCMQYLFCMGPLKFGSNSWGSPTSKEKYRLLTTNDQRLVYPWFFLYYYTNRNWTKSAIHPALVQYLFALLFFYTLWDLVAATQCDINHVQSNLI